MNIYVCVGSSCHIKGSYDVIRMMKDMIETHKLDQVINLSAAFCLGKCTNGVTIKIEDEIICGVSKNNFQDIFQKYVIDRL